MGSLRTAFRLIQLAIVLVAVALAYSYRDAVKEAYDDATHYVRKVNKQLGIDLAYPPSPTGKGEKAPVAEAPAASAPATQAQGTKGEDVAPGAVPPAGTQATGTAAELRPSPSEQAGESAVSEQSPPDEAPPAPADTAAAVPIPAQPAAPQPMASETAAPPEANDLKAPPPTTDTAPGMAPAEAGSAPPSAGPPGKTAATPAGSLLAMLGAARDAVRAGKNEEAVQTYLTLTRRYPDRYEPYGELGNLYYSQGRSPEAAANYYQAAVRLLRAGYLREAQHLQQVLQPLDAGLAASLQTKLTLARLRQR